MRVAFRCFALRCVTWGLPVVLGALGIGYIAGFSHAALAAPPAKQPLVALAAQQIGVRQCLPAINAIAQRGTTGSTLQDIVIDWDHQNPDAAPFFSMTGMGAGTQRAALTITAMPTASGSCAVMVERISSGSGTCADVAAHELPPMPGGKLIDGITVYQNPQNREETYTLIQNPGSCIVIRRQAMFQWPPQR